jgi:hypothetical protein
VIFVFVGEEDEIYVGGLATTGTKPILQFPLRHAAIDKERALDRFVRPLHKKRIAGAAATETAEPHLQATLGCPRLWRRLA